MKTHVKFAIFVMVAFVIFNGLTLSAKQCSKPCGAAIKSCDKVAEAKPACPKAADKSCDKAGTKDCPKAGDKSCDKAGTEDCPKAAAKTCDKAQAKKGCGPKS
ncbi:MAG: hypothetical protein KAJ07_10240 [Planctomycetes bacterium]|nr:hypothetical protein [Planctomycetota bacterium]